MRKAPARNCLELELCQLSVVVLISGKARVGSEERLNGKGFPAGKEERVPCNAITARSAGCYLLPWSMVDGFHKQGTT